MTDEENFSPIFDGGFFGSTDVLPELPRSFMLSLTYRLSDMGRIAHLLAGPAVLLLCSCDAREAATTGADPRAQTWVEIEAAARGATVHFAMWSQDPAINRYIREFVAPRLTARYCITLNIVPAQGDIPNLLANELAADQTESHYDLLWINGENFYKLRELGALYGPFTRRLPNDRYIDLGQSAYRARLPTGRRRHGSAIKVTIAAYHRRRTRSDSAIGRHCAGGLDQQSPRSFYLRHRIYRTEFSQDRDDRTG